MTNEKRLTPAWLAQHLAYAIKKDSVWRVKVLLSHGAHPNWPTYQRTFGVGGGIAMEFQEHLPALFPLEWVGRSQQKNQILIAELLLAAGADLKLYFCWLSIQGPPGFVRLHPALRLCEHISRSKQMELYKDPVKTWLKQTSDWINQWPEPEDERSRKECLELHDRLKRVSWLYDCEHRAVTWATSALL